MTDSGSKAAILPNTQRRASKPFTLNHWQWLLGQKVIARIPVLRRNLIIYREVASAYDGAQVNVSSETLPLPQVQLCREFKAHSDFDLDLTVERHVNLLLLENKTVLGTTGRIVDEQNETLLRFMGERDHVMRNDFMLRPLSRVARPEGVYLNLVGSNRGYRHLYHFMLERMRPLYYLLERFDWREELRVLVRPDLPDFQQRLLTAIAEDYPFVRYIPVKGNECWRIGTLCHVDVAQNALPAFADPGFLEFLRRYYFRAYSVDPEPAARRRIFVSREDTKLRHFTNRDAVHAVLQRHGFETVLAARLGFREQIEAFRDAGAVAATHGAGLTNLIYTPTDAPLFEFLPSNRMRPTYLKLSLAQGRPYHWLQGGPGDQQQHFHLDPDELDRVLSESLP